MGQPAWKLHNYDRSDRYTVSMGNSLFHEPLEIIIKLCSIISLVNRGGETANILRMHKNKTDI